MCYLSCVAFHLSLTPTDPPPANSPTMPNRLVHNKYSKPKIWMGSMFSRKEEHILNRPGGQFSERCMMPKYHLY